MPLLALQVTENKGRSEFFSKTMELFVQHFAKLSPGGLHQGVIGRLPYRQSLELMTTGCAVPQLARNPISDAIEPAPYGIRFANGVSLADEQKKGSLKRVIDIRRLTQQALTNPPDHWPVT
jgi:hypothetical protein